MSTTTNNSPLPDGFMDELLAQLPGSIRHHLIKHSRDLHCHQAQTSTMNDIDNTTEINSQEQLLNHEFRFILSNITRVGKLILSKSGHNLHHILLLCRLIVTGHLCDLIELDLRLQWSSIHISNDKDDDVKNDDDDDDEDAKLLAELSFLMPSILSSLPQLKSLTLPNIGHNQHNYLPFTLFGLFPAGQSSHLEQLSLSESKLRRAHFKYLALDSNYTFPSLTSLDVTDIDLSDIGTSDDYDNDSGAQDDQDDSSALFYLLQWIGKSMPKLTHLSLHCCSLSTSDIATDLTNSPILSRLESLDLSRNPKVEAAGWQTLFASAHFTTSQGQHYGEDPNTPNSPRIAKLKTLKLNSNPKIKPLISFLAQDCPYLANLTTLDLNSCDLDNTSIQSICDSKWIRRLESLSLNFDTKITSDAIWMIADCDGMRNLTSLQLGHRSGRFSLDLLRSITQSQHVSNLTTLNVGLFGISYDQSIDQVLLDFFHSPKASALTDLSLRCTSIPKSTMKSIVLSPMLSNLEIVSFYSDRSDDKEWIDAFVHSSNCRKLHTLTLLECNLTDSTVLSISQSQYLSNLRYLDLTNNPALTDHSVKYLSRSARVRLKELNLTYNPLLTPLIFHHLVQSPQLLAGLEKLSLWECPLIENDHQDIFTKAGWFDGEVITDPYQR